MQLLQLSRIIKPIPNYIQFITDNRVFLNTLKMLLFNLVFLFKKDFKKKVLFKLLKSFIGNFFNHQKRSIRS